MSQFRMQKLDAQLQNLISDMILSCKIKDPRVSNMLVINRVDITRDLKFAKVYVSSFLSEESVKRGVEGLQNAAGFIQSVLAKKLTIRQFPKLTFIADFSTKEGMAMVEKLKDMEAQQQKDSE